MNRIIRELIELEKLEENLFRGRSHELGLNHVFGGQVIGQALNAAGRTVEGRQAHSVHAYFLLPGDDRAPIVYEVDRIREGRSFTTRRVKAIQHGKAIFNLSASFQIEETGLEHQFPMPETEAPENFPDLLEVFTEEGDTRDFVARLVRDVGIEIRPVFPRDPYEQRIHPPHKSCWFRISERLPENSNLHQSLLAYASDFGLLLTAAQPHDISFLHRNVQGASLDHSLWFHRNFRADDWLLYVTDSPSAGNARGFTRGSIYARDGRLVASVAQEGLMRVYPVHQEGQEGKT